MAFLFTVEHKRVVPTTEALLVSPYKEIWERDTLEGKEIALQELAYVEFMASLKKSNPYSGYPDEAVRNEKIMKDVIKIDGWEPDSLVLQAITKLQEIQKGASPTFAYYQSALTAAKKMRSFFDRVNLNERNEKTGMPVYKPKDITSALIDTERVIQNLASLHEKVVNEIYENAKVRGQKQVSEFANPDTL